MGDKERKPWGPTAEFIESDPRSRAIRDACIPVIQSYARLIEEEDLTIEDEADELGIIVDGRQNLIDLGIEKRMHLVGKKKFAARALTDPVMPSEFAASQLLELIEEMPINAGDLHTYLTEFYEGVVGDRAFYNPPWPPPPKIQRFFTQRETLNGIKMYLGMT